MSIQQILAESMGLEATVINTVDSDDSIIAIESTSAMGDAELEMAESEVAIEITERTMAGLEGLAAAIEVEQANGGMDEAAARGMDAAVKSVLGFFDGRTTKPMPSVESFSGDGGRVTATGYALEGIRDTIANMWESIMRLIVKAVDAIKKFFAANFTQLGRIEGAAKSLKERAANSKGTPKEKEIDFANTSYLKNASGKVVGSDPGVVGDIGKMLDGSYGTLDNALGAILAKKSFSLAELKGSVKAANAVAAKGKFKDIPGGWETTCKVPSTDDGTQLFTFSSGTIKDPKGKVKTIGSSEIAAVCTAIGSSAPEMAKAVKEMNKMMDETSKRLNQVGATALKDSRLKDNATSEASVDIKRGLSMLNRAFSTARSIQGARVRVGTKFLASSLSYCKACYDNLETK